MDAAGAVSCYLEACMKKKGSQLLHLCCHPGILAQSIASDSDDGEGKVNWSLVQEKPNPKGEREWLYVSCKSYFACGIMDILYYVEMGRVGKRLWVLLLIRAGDLYLNLHPETSLLLLGPKLPTSGMPLHCCVAKHWDFSVFHVPSSFWSQLMCREPRGFIMDVGVVSLFVFLWFFPSGDQTQKCNRKVVDLILIGNDSLTTSAHFPGSLFAKLTKTAE